MLAWVQEVGSGRFRKVGSGRSRKVPESSGAGACWCRFQRQGSEFSGGFGKVPESSGTCWSRFRSRVGKVPESSGVVCCLATLTGAAM